MRIAYLSADPGVPVFGTKGASVHIQEMVRALRARGAVVTVYTTRRGDHPPADLDDLRVVERRVPKGDTAARERAVADIADRLADDAIADGCDLVYERFSLFSAAASRVGAATGAPAVLEVNAPLIDEQRDHRELVDEPRARSLARAALSGATVVACVSEPVARWAGDHGARRPIVVPNGVNTDRIRPALVRPAAGSPFAIGFVGTLKPWHGLDVLVEAMALLRDDARASRLVVIGDGPEGPELRRRTADAGIDALFHGAVAPADVAPMLGTLDVGVAPYRAGDSYFSPLKVGEYLAAGLPVVASRVGQVPQLVRHGRTGILVDPGDPAALAGALRLLRDRPALRDRLAVAARAHAVEALDWSTVADRVLRALGQRAAA